MKRPALTWLGGDPLSGFPDPATALAEPDGLLAAGGDLSPCRLLDAYRRGIFPWFSDGQPPLWWSPDPRMVFDTTAVATSSRFRRSLRDSRWTIGADTAFADVIDICARIPRDGQPGTWITDAMIHAYVELHRMGHAHSIEVRDDGELIGGVYGVAIGRMFFGESMFSRRPDGSKVALAALAHVLHGWGWPMIDAQVENPHLLSLGAYQLPRARFLEAVGALVAADGREGSWTAAFGSLPAASLSMRATGAS